MWLHKAVDVVSKGTQTKLHSLSSCQSPETPLGSPPLTPLYLLPVCETLQHTSGSAALLNMLCNAQPQNSISPEAAAESVFTLAVRQILQHAQG